MSSLFDWLVSLGPGPWAFGIAALATVVFTAVTLSRMYCKYRSREAERRVQERTKQLRLQREIELLREVRESRQFRDHMLKFVLERETARWARENADDDGDEERDAASEDG